MEEDSTTVADNSVAEFIESTSTTEQQTGQEADNLDTSTSTDTSAAGETTSTSTDDSTSTTPTFDTDIDDWATKTGRSVPTSDSERALLQEVRDGQREYSRSKQAKDVSRDVSKAIADAAPTATDEEFVDPLEKDVRDLKMQLANSEAVRLRSEYVSEKGVTIEESNVMGEILKEKVEKGGKTAFDFWTNPDNLEDWHTLAKARMASSTTVDNSEIEAKAAASERERIARESKANGPSRNASSTQTSTKTAEQQRLERFSTWD